MDGDVYLSPLVFVVIVVLILGSVALIIVSLVRHLYRLKNRRTGSSEGYGGSDLGSGGESFSSLHHDGGGHQSGGFDGGGGHSAGGGAGGDFGGGGDGGGGGHH